MGQITLELDDEVKEDFLDEVAQVEVNMEYEGEGQAVFFAVSLASALTTEWKAGSKIIIEKEVDGEIYHHEVHLD